MFYLKATSVIHHGGQIVRQVIRAPFTLAFRATMEEEYAQEEEQLFEQLPETRILDHRHNNTAGGNQVAWLNAERGKMLGPSRTQEVQEGDSLTLEVDVIFDKKRKGILHPSALIKSGSQTLWKDRLLEGVQNLNFPPEINPMLIYEFTRLLLAEIESKKTPESYLMYALYDQDSVLYDQGKVLVSNAAANEHEQLRQTLKVKNNGYLETFVVNETAQNIYFDNLRVQSTSPIIVQENAYYPFGMTIAGLDYSYNNHTNLYLYNGKELIEDNGLQYYDYGARMYDPTIGRWSVVDPMAMEYHDVSPYIYSINNPIRFIDPDGNRVWDMTTDKAQKSALAKFARTKEGRRFLAQYAKAGDVIGGVKFAEDGKYSHQDVAFYTSNLGSKTHGITRSYLKTKRGNHLDLKHVTTGTVNENLGNLDNLSFAVDISKGISENDALLTIGHEAFIHVEKTTQDVEKGIADLQNGKFGSTASLFGDFAKFMSGLSGDESDHKLAVDGKVVNMEQFVKALDELHGGNTFTQKYEAWKEHQKKEENK